jgi:O-antigen biosynthesis protein WbqP
MGMGRGKREKRRRKFLIFEMANLNILVKEDIEKDIRELENSWTRGQRFYVKYFKPVLDFVFALLVLIILSPLFLVVSIAIKIDSRGPVFFRQKRIGRNKEEFYIFKFRTMKIETPRDIPTHLMKDSNSYITKIGRYLRKTSIDEVPQLINILKGEISFIGPRPALWNQFDLIRERDKYFVNKLYPGITGWAQVNGRDELSIEDKAKFDREYVNKIGICFEVKIFFKTVAGVLYSKGIC